MDRRIFFALLLPFALLTCGFTWGLGKGDPCNEASKAVAELTPETPAQLREKITKRVIKECPDGAAASYLRGLSLEAEKKSAEALGAYRSATSKDPRLADAHGRLGLLLLGKGEREEASVELITALQLKDSPSYARAAAEIFLEGKLHALAIHFFEQALPAYADDADLRLEMGRAYLGMGKSARARSLFQEALRLDPAGAAGHLGLAGCYRQEKQFNGAIDELRLALAADSGNRESHYQLGQLLELTGKSEEADREYHIAGVERSLGAADYLKKAADYTASGSFEMAAAAYDAYLLKKPDAPGIREKLADARMAAGHDLEAINAYEEANRRREGSSRISCNLGILYERKGNLDEAINSFQEAIRLDAGNGDARRRLAEIHALRGSFSAAIDQYRELIGRHDANPLIYYKLARLLEKDRDFPGAAGAYAKAVALDPNNTEAHRGLAFLLLYRHLPGNVEKELSEVLRLRPADLEARNALIALYVKQKRYDETTALLKEDVLLNPENPDSHYRLGVMYAFRHQDDAARGSFEKTIQLKPDHARALNALGKLYLKAGDSAKAQEAFAAAHKADPKLLEPIDLSNRLVPAPEKKGAAHRRASAAEKKRSTKRKGAGKVRPTYKKHAGKRQ